MKDLTARKIIRLKDYDYSQAGYYFITICIKDRHELLWDAPVGAVIGRPPLSDIGTLVDKGILQINKRYNGVTVDKYVIMPNHVHMIIIISGNPDIDGRPMTAPTISWVINHLKGSISKQLSYSIWQKSYHDRVIRDEAEYQRIWQYIDDNPARWDEDEYNPKLLNNRRNIP